MIPQVLCLLLALKIQYPSRVFVVRGNHEDSAMNKNYGFGTECMSRFGGEQVGGVWPSLIYEIKLCVHLKQKKLEIL